MEILKNDDLLSEILPKKDVIGLVTYQIDKDEINPYISQYLKNNGFDIVRIHLFLMSKDKSIFGIWNTFKKNNYCLNVTLHDISRDEREGKVYLNRSDEEELQKIKYISNGSYYVKDKELLENINEICQKAINKYTKTNIFVKMYKHFTNK